MPSFTDEFGPGEKVLWSGIYSVTHDRNHRERHDVTCVAHHTFPPCNHCGHHPRFVLKYKAVHVTADESFS